MNTIKKISITTVTILIGSLYLTSAFATKQYTQIVKNTSDYTIYLTPSSSHQNVNYIYQFRKTIPPHQSVAINFSVNDGLTYNEAWIDQHLSLSPDFKSYACFKIKFQTLSGHHDKESGSCSTGGYGGDTMGLSDSVIPFYLPNMIPITDNPGSKKTIFNMNRTDTGKCPGCYKLTISVTFK